MKGNPTVIEYLNKALTSELTAVNQYWLHYRLLDDWGYTKLAKKEREESIEEMHHADKLVTRIIFLEGFPNMQKLDPLMIGQNVKEILECDLKAEYGARALYMEARMACRKEEDFVSMDIKLPSMLEGPDPDGGREPESVLNLEATHAEFLHVMAGLEGCAKIVVSDRTGEGEVEEAADLVAGINRGLPVFIQPVFADSRPGISTDRLHRFHALLSRRLRDVRVSVQIHKILGVR